MNKKLVYWSVFGLICLVLTFLVHWYFILGSAVAVFVNQREILNK